MPTSLNPEKFKGLWLYGGLALAVSTVTTVAILSHHDAMGVFSLGALWLVTLVIFLYSYRRPDRTLLDLTQSQKENARSQLWFESSLDLHSTTLIKTRTFEFLSPGWERALGWSIEELKAHTYDFFIHPDDLQRTTDLVSQKRGAGDLTDRFINRYRHKDGHWVWMEWVGHSDGVRGYATARDITKWYMKHNDLKHWQIISLDLVATSDIENEGRWGYVSPGLVATLGYPKEILKITPWMDFIYGGFVIKTIPLGNLSRFNAPMKTSNGGFVWLQWTETIDPDSGRTYMSAQDITDSVRTQNEMRDAISDLEIANAALSRFASMAAHQLRSPPRGIIGAVEVLQQDFKDKLPVEANEYLEDIRCDAITMSNVVDGLHKISDVSRLGEVELTRVSLKEVLDHIQATQQRLGPCQAQTCKLEVANLENLPDVIGNKVFLIEAISNLIDNGLKFNSSETPTVWVTGCLDVDCREVQAEYPSTEPSETVCLHVRDNGVGIDMKFRHKLFGLFERLTTKFEGTGIGLYLVRIMVERMRGKVEVESVLGVGSIFTLHLPCHGSFPQQAKEEIQTRSPDWPLRATPVKE